MAATVVNRGLGRWEIRVCKAADGDADRAVLKSLLCMKQVGAADRAEPKSKTRAVISGADVLRSMARHHIGRRKGRQRGEDATRAALTGQAMANADTARLALHLNAELTA